MAKQARVNKTTLMKILDTLQERFLNKMSLENLVDLEVKARIALYNVSVGACPVYVVTGYFIRVKMTNVVLARFEPLYRSLFKWKCSPTIK